MRAVHWFLTTIDRGTSALSTPLYGPPEYSVEQSALWQRLLFFGMVVLLLVCGILASW